MKTFFRFAFLAVACAGLAACATNRQNEQEPYQRKIYLTEQDYMEDLTKAAQVERREAKPNVESDYIFEVQPQTQKNIYFFDDRTRPLVPDQATDRDYKKTKRLWEKPRRYSPEEYYGNQPAESSSGSSYSSGYYDESDY